MAASLCSCVISSSVIAWSYTLSLHDALPIYAPRDVGVQKRDDSFVEAGVDAAQQRLVLPGLEVALDFRLVLGERPEDHTSALLSAICVVFRFLPVRLFSIAAWLP